MLIFRRYLKCILVGENGCLGLKTLLKLFFGINLMLAFLLFPINYGESAVNYSDNFNSNSNFIPSTINDSTSGQARVTSEKDIGSSVE